MSVATKEQTGTLRALIVEDMEDDALLLVDYLQSSGFALEWRRVDSEDALRNAMLESWDIVFSDFSMPKFNGKRALQVVREIDPDLPLIFVSGTIGEDVAVEAMKAGAQNYVMKGSLKRLPSAVTREIHDAALRREQREAEVTLRKLSMAVNQAASSVFITDPEGCIEYVNLAFERLTGFTQAEVLGRTPAILCSGQNDGAVYSELWRKIRGGEVFRGTLVNRRKDGSLFYEDKIIAPIKDGDGRITHFVSTGNDITQRVRADQDRSRLAAILEGTPDIVAILRPDGQVVYLNHAGRARFALAPDIELGRLSVHNLFPDQFSERLLDEIFPRVGETGSWSGEAVLMTSSGIRVPVSQVVLRHLDEYGEVEYFSTVIRDISEQKRYEAELKYRATHDRLTNLPNRFMLSERLEQEIERIKFDGSQATVMFLDLDDFKRINDSLGHAAGDAVLQAVARRLRTCMRPSDLAASHGGDEFTVLMSEPAGFDDVMAMLHKLREVIERPVLYGMHEIFVTFCAGIALCPADGDNVTDLLRNADSALYRAKSSGAKQYSFYSSDMNARGDELLSLEADLRRALSNGEFHLEYQPQVDLTSGSIIGAEALIRWVHPAHGLISPVDFVPMLEKTGLIDTVGEWVMHQACEDCRAWHAAGFAQLRVSVNVSALQFNDVELLGKVRRAIEEEALPAELLELELTENIVMRDPQGATEILQALHSMGVRIAVDDFGTGYSSMAYLKTFPIDVLKIDQTFMRGVEIGDSSDAAIVEASVLFARKLGLEVVAEGVETRAQLDFLRDCGCHLAQGFFMSRPLPQAKLLALLCTHPSW